MADIIDFRAKTKPHLKPSKVKKNDENYGEIILFSGVRFSHDDVEDSEFVAIDTQLKQSAQYLETKSR
ncbi:MAG: hypothetical protein HRU29_03285 [Rhizobiales bacterium]|nr:hypothetical protein [Hyphomicrobiales bacterium]NRB13402.1 hypothetical protein [Hyphomicrobiales bacterium]